MHKNVRSIDKVRTRWTKHDFIRLPW